LRAKSPAWNRSTRGSDDINIPSRSLATSTPSAATTTAIAATITASATASATIASVASIGAFAPVAAILAAAATAIAGHFVGKPKLLHRLATAQLHAVVIIDIDDQYLHFVSNAANVLNAADET
jgi:hypothetical protein